MEVYADIGNTTATFAYKENNGFVEFCRIDSKELIVGKYLTNAVSLGLKRHNHKLNDISLICLCSVRPMWDDLINELANYCNVPFYQIKHNLVLQDFEVEPYNPKSIGADLLIAGYGARWIYPNTNTIIVNLGTATTVSAIVKNQFMGAIIMPGLAISADCLFRSAQLLQKFDYTFEAKPIGANTKEAINLGLVNGHYYAIDQHVKNVTKAIGGMVQCLVLGGNANVIWPLFDKSRYKLAIDLIFQGMEMALIHNNVIEN